MGALVKTLGKDERGRYRYPRDVENAKRREYRARVKAGVAPQHNRTPRKLKDRECKACGKVFRPESARVWCCSKSCAGHLAASNRGYVKSSPVFFYVCATCGLVGTCRQPSQKTCSPGCAAKFRAAKSRAASQRASQRDRSPRACCRCGRTFAPKYGDMRRRFCSARCLRRHGKAKQGNNHRKRARAAGVAYEPVNPGKVFARDGWTCQVCGKRTPEVNRGTCYSNAPELDHRVPLALGGPHTYANVQCTCRACNQRKGGHTVAGQLSLLEET